MTAVRAIPDSGAAMIAQFTRRFGFLRRGIALSVRAARGLTMTWAGLLFLQGLLAVAVVAASKMAIDRAGDALGGRMTFARAAVPLLLIAGLWLVAQLLASVLDYVRTAQAERVKDYVHDLIQRKSTTLDLAFYDDPDDLDLLHLARTDAVQQPSLLLEHVGTIAQSGVTLLGLALLLTRYAVWLPLLLVASALPGLWVVAQTTLREHAFRVASITHERRATYFDWILGSRESAMEVRLFDLGDHHRAAFRRERAWLSEGRLRVARERLRVETLAGVLAWMGAVGGMAMLLTRPGAFGLGDVVLCYQAFLQGQRLLRTLLESAGGLYRSLLFLESFFTLLAREPSLPVAPSPRPLALPLREGIRFEDVSFRYPERERAALGHLSLVLPAGRMVAIVGANGAGKSTLIKLLCRFYDPSAGRVTWDGVDARELDPVAIRRAITVLFQEPVRYHATVRESIGMGDTARASGDEHAVEAAAGEADAVGVVDRLPEGFETLLGKWLGGTDLSVGEWQRLALARAFVRRADVLVLDEPTSAMDSWAEERWLHRFRELAAGRTTLVITHRFSAAMHADEIVVMDGGQVSERGTHGDLLARDGRYARGFRAQATVSECA